MCYTARVKSIGVRELQQHASRIIREVEAGEGDYVVTVQGRATSVVIAKGAGDIAEGATAQQVLATPFALDRDDEVTRALLEMLEAGRDASGTIGSASNE